MQPCYDDDDAGSFSALIGKRVHSVEWAPKFQRVFLVVDGKPVTLKPSIEGEEDFGGRGYIYIPDAYIAEVKRVPELRGQVVTSIEIIKGYNTGAFSEDICCVHKYRLRTERGVCTIKVIASGWGEGRCCGGLRFEAIGE